VKPATVHQEFRIISHMLNVGVRRKRLSDNPCRAVEFPVPVAKSTHKPGIEPPTPAFSGLLTDKAKRIGINGS
jgi:hypothetical protein